MRKGGRSAASRLSIVNRPSTLNERLRMLGRRFTDAIDARSSLCLLPWGYIGVNGAWCLRARPRLRVNPMAARFISQFMWGYQGHYAHAVKYLAEKVLEEIGADPEVQVFLVG